MLERVSDLMEKDLILVGATAVEDKLQPGVLIYITWKLVLACGLGSGSKGLVLWFGSKWVGSRSKWTILCWGFGNGQNVYFSDLGRNESGRGQNGRFSVVGLVVGQNGYFNDLGVILWFRWLGSKLAIDMGWITGQNGYFNDLGQNE